MSADEIKKKSGIGIITKKLVYWVFVTSTLLTIVTTLAQVGYDYSKDMKKLDENAVAVNSIFQKSLATSLYKVDVEGMQQQLEGLLSIDHMSMVELYEVLGDDVKDQNLISSKGTKPKKFKEFSINLMDPSVSEGERQRIGMLKVYANVGEIYAAVTEKFAVVLVTNTVKSILASIIMVLLFQYLVTKHVLKISKHFAKFDIKNGKTDDLAIRKPGEKKSFWKRNEDDELDQLVAAFNVMKNQLVATYEELIEYKEGLEQKVEERTKQVSEKTEKIRSIFNSISQGIFTVDANHRVSPEYSISVESIFETTQISDRSVFDLVFSDTNLSTDLLDQVKESLNSIIGELDFNFEANKHLLVGQVTKSFPKGGHAKILEIGWECILGHDRETVAEVVVVVKDVTELMALRSESNKKAQELKIMDVALRVGFKNFNRFVNDSTGYFDGVMKLAAELGKGGDKDVLTEAFRALHTVKGMTRLYGIDSVAGLIHNLEKEVQDALRGGNKVERLSVEEQIAAIKVDFQKVSQIRDKLKGMSGDNALPAGLDKVDLSTQEGRKVGAYLLLDSYIAKQTDSIQSIVSPLLEGVNASAHVMGRENPQVVIQDLGAVRFDARAAKTLGDAFVHCLRNSVAHGIEAGDVRTKAGKDSAGKIMLSAFETKFGGVEVHIQDDGKGLNLNALKKKALEMGEKISDDPTELAQLIFRSGLSTADSITEISGRGVGMDAVKAYLEQLGCSISIAFTGPKTPENFVPFKLVIHVPEKFLLRTTESSSLSSVA